MSNEIVGWAIFEIWKMGYLVRVLGDLPEIFETPIAGWTGVLLNNAYSVLGSDKLESETLILS